jgi:hypothetical protein
LSSAPNDPFTKSLDTNTIREQRILNIWVPLDKPTPLQELLWLVKQVFMALLPLSQWQEFMLLKLSGLRCMEFHLKFTESLKAKLFADRPHH